MKAFTLVETVITIFIFALALVAVTGFIAFSYRTHGYTRDQSIAIDEARRGIETMVKEIREARTGDDGSFPIEKAEDKEFIFYSDIDKDGATERVRYFLGTVNTGSQTQYCVTFSDGGSCGVTFSNFLTGNPEEILLEVSVEGDFGWGLEYAEIYADGNYLGGVCQSGCSDCAATWQGTAVFDVTTHAGDDFIQLNADATSSVNDICDWEEPNHAMKVRYELRWTESIPGADHEFKKGVVNPTGSPVEYPLDQEEIIMLSNYVRNSPPIFEYFDEEGNKIESYPARLIDTRLMKVFLVVDVDINNPPQSFELESWIQVRNLKSEY
jgi:hypothetical protein